MLRKQERRVKRKSRVRGKISGTAAKPRLSVFRSNKHIFAQLIDDNTGATLVHVSDLSEKKGKKSEKAKTTGMALAKEAKSKKIETVTFDRNGYRYHGRVAALAAGAREGGLKF
jgi:large subunit ribosomal protein L18